VGKLQITRENSEKTRRDKDWLKEYTVKTDRKEEQSQRTIYIESERHLALSRDINMRDLPQRTNTWNTVASWHTWLHMNRTTRAARSANLLLAGTNPDLYSMKDQPNVATNVLCLSFAKHRILAHRTHFVNLNLQYASVRSRYM